MENYFARVELDEFWLRVEKDYPDLSQRAVEKLLLFSTTFLSEAAFSTMSLIKTKQRNRMDAHDATILAISDIQPRLKELSKTVLKNKHTYD